MPEVDEGDAGGQLSQAAVLKTGLNVLSNTQEITFVKYNRVILPADGFAFWVRADTLTPGALYNTFAFNTTRFNLAPGLTATANVVKARGSLHYTTVNTQDETAGFSVNRVVFTSQTDIEELNTVSPKTMYIGEFEGLKFAFTVRSSFYRQSDLYHYQGDAVYPSMASQIIDFPEQLPTELIVSNSLPIWLTLNQTCPMYPSFLVSEDIVPPWCSVHIPEDDTWAMQATAYIDDIGSHYQLARDTVKLTFYGLNNAAVLDFLDYVNQFSLNTDAFGIMNSPIVRDSKATQAELNIISQKKTIEFEVSYYQKSVRHIARQYIKSAFIEEIFLQPE